MWHTESNSLTQVKPISFETRDRGAYIGDTQNCPTLGLFAVAWPHALQTQRLQARRLPGNRRPCPGWNVISSRTPRLIGETFISIGNGFPEG
jgi:hypothetical protein